MYKDFQFSSRIKHPELLKIDNAIQKIIEWVLKQQNT